MIVTPPYSMDVMTYILTNTGNISTSTYTARITYTNYALILTVLPTIPATTIPKLLFNSPLIYEFAPPPVLNEKPRITPNLHLASTQISDP
jgi:hypothetical protein